MSGESREYGVRVGVPATDETAAGIVTQRLQEASTTRPHIGAWVVRRREGEEPGASDANGDVADVVLVDFVVRADTAEEARELALAWVRSEVSRGGALEGVGEPAVAVPAP